MEDENILFMAVAHDGTKYNVRASNIFEAVDEIRQSVEAHDIDPKEIFMVIDIPG